MVKVAKRPSNCLIEIVSETNTLRGAKKPGEAKKNYFEKNYFERKSYYSICKGPRITLPRGPEFVSAALLRRIKKNVRSTMT